MNLKIGSKIVSTIERAIDQSDWGIKEIVLMTLVLVIPFSILFLALYIGIKKYYYKLNNKYIIKEYYTEGPMRAEIPYFNDLKHGDYKKYHENGVLYIITPYIKHYEDGIERGYFSDGSLNWEITYVNGKRHGKYKSYSENGDIQIECSFFNNEKNGIEKEYNKYGIMEFPWVKNQIHGVGKQYDKNRNLIDSHYYIYDEKITYEEWRKHELINKLAGLK